MGNPRHHQFVFNFIAKGLITIANLVDVHTRNHPTIRMLPDKLREVVQSRLSNALLYLCKPQGGIVQQPANGALIARGIEPADSYDVVVSVGDYQVDGRMEAVSFPSKTNVLSEAIRTANVADGHVSDETFFSKLNERSPDALGVAVPKSMLTIPLVYGYSRCGVIYVSSNHADFFDSSNKSECSLIGAAIGSILWHMPSETAPTTY